MLLVIRHLCPTVKGILSIGIGHGWVITTTHFDVDVISYPSHSPSWCWDHSVIIEVKIPVPCYVKNVCYSVNSGTSTIRLLVSDLDLYQGGLTETSFTSIQFYDVSTTNSHGHSFAEPPAEKLPANKARHNFWTKHHRNICSTPLYMFSGT